MNCLHFVFKSKTLPEVSVCQECGAISLDRHFTVKPIEHKYKCDIDPLEIYKYCMSSNKLSNFVESSEKRNSLCINKEFFSRRTFGIRYLKTFVQHAKFSMKTLYLSIFILEKILMHFDYELDLIIYLSFIIAAKFCENQTHLLKTNYTSIMTNKMTDTDLRKYEFEVLTFFNFNLSCTTSYDFLVLLCNNGIVFSDELYKGIYLDQLYKLTFDTLETLIEDDKFFNFTPIQNALAVVSTVREYYSLSLYPKRLEYLYGVQYECIRHCIYVHKLILNIIGDSVVNYTMQDMNGIPDNNGARLYFTFTHCNENEFSIGKKTYVLPFNYKGSTFYKRG